MEKDTIDFEREWNRDEFLNAINSDDFEGCTFFCYFASVCRPTRMEIKIAKDNNIVDTVTGNIFSLPSKFEISIY